MKKDISKKWLRGEKGISMTGYGLMVGLIGIIAISAIGRTGEAVKVLFGGVGNALEAVVGGGSSSSEPLVSTSKQIYVGDSAPLDATQCSLADPCLLSDVEAHGGYGTGTSGDPVEIFLTEAVTATETLNLPSNTMLKSTGGVFEISGDGTFALVSLDAGASDVTIDGVDFDNGLSAIMAAAGATRSDITISNVTVNSSTGAVDGNDDALHLEDIDGLVLTNIVVDDFGDDAVEIRFSSAVTLNGLTVTNPRLRESVGLFLDNVDGGTGGSTWTDISYDGALSGVPHAVHGIVVEFPTGTHEFIEASAPYTVRNMAEVSGDGDSGVGILLNTLNILMAADITLTDITLQNIEGRYSALGVFNSAGTISSGVLYLHGASNAQSLTIDNLTLEQTGGSQAIPAFGVNATRVGTLQGDFTFRLLNSSLTSFLDWGIRIRAGSAMAIIVEVDNNVVTMSKVGGVYQSTQNEAFSYGTCDTFFAGRSQDVAVTNNQFSNSSHDSIQLACSHVETSRVNVSNNSELFGGFGGVVRGMHIIFGGASFVTNHHLTVENNNIIVSDDGGNTTGRRAIEVDVNSGNLAGSSLCARINGNQSGSALEPRRIDFELGNDTALDLRSAGVPVSGGTLTQNMIDTLVNENTNESAAGVINLPALGNSLAQGVCDQPILN